MAKLAPGPELAKNWKGDLLRPAKPISIPRLTCRHWACAASADSCAKMVFSMAMTAGRCFGAAWASALRSQCTRQRCWVALKTLAAAARKPL